MEDLNTINLVQVNGLTTNNTIGLSVINPAFINYYNKNWLNSTQESSIEEDIKNNIKPRLNFIDLDTDEKLSIYDNLEIKPTITIDKIKEVVNNTLTDALKEDLSSYYLKQYPIALGYNMQPGTGLREQLEKI